MYAYVDETGNTGRNLFDNNQPDFFTAALMCRTNFDFRQKRIFLKLAKKVGARELHGNELGLGKIDTIADDLLTIFKKNKVRFFICRVEKKFLVVSKFFDTLFDSYENKAVHWHVYNYRQLRLILVFKLAYILEEEQAIMFWNSILESNKDRAYKKFKEFLALFKKNITFIPDDRSREIVSEAVKWALSHPESIYLHSNSKAARRGHLPNVAIFPALLGGIEQKSKLWKQQVREIVHDRQCEFEQILKDWHELFSNATTGVIHRPFDEKISIRRVAGSNFRISQSGESPGIQAIDIVLWLYKKIACNKQDLTPSSIRLMRYVIQHGYQDDLSFEATNHYLTQAIGETNARPFGKEEQETAKEMMKTAELSRQKAMASYINAKQQ